MRKHRVVLLGTLFVAIASYSYVKGQSFNIVTVDTTEKPSGGNLQGTRVSGFTFTTMKSFNNVRISAKLIASVGDSSGTVPIEVRLRYLSAPLPTRRAVVNVPIASAYFKEWIPLFGGIPQLDAGSYQVRFWQQNPSHHSSSAIQLNPTINTEPHLVSLASISSGSKLYLNNDAENITLEPLATGTQYLFKVEGDPPTPVPATPVSIVAKHSGKCLDVTGGSIAKGTLLQQYDCNGFPQQRFWITSAGSSSSDYKVVTFDGQVLDIKDRSTASGAPIQSWTFLDGTNQKWRIVSTGPGEFKIVSVSNFKVLAVGSGPSYTNNGAPIQVWDDNGLANQRFQLVSNPEAAPAGIVKLVSKFSQKCLDVPNGSIADGTRLQVWDCNGNPQQTFWLTKTISGDYLIIGHSGKVLDAYAWGTANGTPVQQWEFLGGTNQRWYLTETAANEFVIKGVGSGRVLDVAGGLSPTPNGATLQLWDALGTGNQIWKLQYVK
ncbi:MAG: RICIN domain-containing protein [Bryobacterales bacterium]|nr:RICIN domain-containing protein [Bryobacterales bacterium]